ncbi:hypothetical protein LWI29_025719 [Acer saccharum]|uniref:Uncharacterized protein n=1 Tax=Acer saccharum TaxID=4024 RepID=A0AA39RN48_ACESA|nr:hypothetical protein LWI29_025719 [Acer saccharum]
MSLRQAKFRAPSRAKIFQVMALRQAKFRAPSRAEILKVMVLRQATLLAPSRAKICYVEAPRQATCLTGLGNSLQKYSITKIFGGYLNNPSLTHHSISQVAIEGHGDVMLTLNAANIENTQFTSFGMVLNQALDHHTIFFNQERIYTLRVGTAAPLFSGIVVCMTKSFVYIVTMTITSAHMVFGGFGQDITLDHNSYVIAGDLGNVPIQFALSVVDLFSIVKGKGIYNSNMVWINGSHFAPSMLNFHVPSIGELLFFFV